MRASWLLLLLLACGRDPVALGGGDYDPDDGGLLDLGELPDADASISDRPITDAPISDRPITDAPISDRPITDAPISDRPITDAPISDRPITDAPISDRPITDAPISDRPITDAPISDRPITDAPISDRPITDAPISDRPITDGPVSDGGNLCDGVDCSALSGPCFQGVCEPSTGMCRRQLLPEGTLCSDSNNCTTNDFCSMGVCQAGQPLDCSALSDACNVGLCNPVTGQCARRTRPNGTSCDDGDSCTFADACQNGLCSGSGMGPPGDTCATALPISISAPGTFTETGFTGCGMDGQTGSCAMPGAPQVIYRAQLDGPRRISATLLPTGFDAALYARSTCEDSATELVCAQPPGLSASVPQQVYLPPQAFFFADGAAANQSGDYSLELQVDPQDTCMGVVTLPEPPPNGSVSVLGTTIGSQNNFQPGCGSGMAGDHVYRLDLTQPRRLRIETSGTPFGQYDTLLGIRQAICDTGAFIECDDDDGPSNLSRIDREFMPGTYFVVVDGFGSSVGAYTLTIRELPPPVVMTFPDATDTRFTQVPDQFAFMGEVVEGARTPGLATVSAVSSQLQLVNNLTCDRLAGRLNINGQLAGTFNIMPGQALLNINATLNQPVNGPLYVIRFEVQRSVMMGCGFVELPNGVSTLSLSP